MFDIFSCDRKGVVSWSPSLVFPANQWRFNANTQAWTLQLFPITTANTDLRISQPRPTDATDVQNEVLLATLQATDSLTSSCRWSGPSATKPCLARTCHPRPGNVKKEAFRYITPPDHTQQMQALIHVLCVSFAVMYVGDQI